MSRPPAGIGRPSSGRRRLKDLLVQSDNRSCADCGAPDPKWASANIGVFICLKCCGVHRSLGTHISKVLSVTLDEWSDDEIDAMIEVGGNASANSIYEAFIPQGYTKPGPESGHEERAKFIRSKYELQEFLKPSLRISSIPSNSKKNSLKASLSRKIMDTFSSSSSQKLEGMVEFIGMLKVKVLKGINLAVRDMLSSDPYVVLTLGQQKVQTGIIRSNLNPVWNEELMLSVPQNFGPVKLEVYDHDTFSADDIMGQAEIDIQPMITSAMAFGDAGMFGNMQIGKWLKSNDNALKEDSTVHIIDGKVKQDVSLKLQNVESGELELELEWIPLEQ
ncbi:ADP-ribosylation factor GTPase-activating protein AGD12 [Camellia lanceoleosa]|uniref:ADP-ribosylation factor GTPase-activating protein AGD12 n=1 Tax=Camellia lanceoleosa TaxID=1840588 RepID=A0ACC0GEC4_9ERIC|nr:ADP-ribosylation factor GTPase-activating protein AGD12 [Camellia lanceoleosa]